MSMFLTSIQFSDKKITPLDEFYYALYHDKIWIIFGLFDGSFYEA